jgi:peptide/nickel transport system permease protein
MLIFLLRRLLQAGIALWAISLLVFVIMFRMSDPVATLLPQNASPQQRAQLRTTLGLDQPLATQYLRYMGRLLRGDMGISYYNGRPIGQLLLERTPATLELAVISLLFAVAVGIPLGVLAGARPRALSTRLLMGGSLFGISLPTFWLGLILMMVFGVWLGWLPNSGRGATRHLLGTDWSFLTLNGWRHLILPAVTLALYNIAMLMRLVRSELHDTLERPFIRVARARGLSEAAVVGKHALANSLIPVITVLGLQLGSLLAFSVVTETIFQWPGLGKLLIDSIQVDRPLVIGYLLLTGAVFLLINFVVDLLYAWIDPRIRWSSAQGD